MSRHWVKQSDVHKGKVGRFCFQSNLAFIVSLVYFGIKDLLYWAQINKKNLMGAKVRTQKFQGGGSGQTCGDTAESFTAHHPAECECIWSIKFPDMFQRIQGGEGGTEPIILLQYILGKGRQIYI